MDGSAAGKQFFRDYPEAVSRTPASLPKGTALDRAALAVYNNPRFTDDSDKRVSALVKAIREGADPAGKKLDAAQLAVRCSSSNSEAELDAMKCFNELVLGMSGADAAAERADASRALKHDMDKARVAQTASYQNLLSKHDRKIFFAEPSGLEPAVQLHAVRPISIARPSSEQATRFNNALIAVYKVERFTAKGDAAVGELVGAIQTEALPMADRLTGARLAVRCATNDTPTSTRAREAFEGLLLKMAPADAQREREAATKALVIDRDHQYPGKRQDNISAKLVGEVFGCSPPAARHRGLHFWHG